MSPITILSIDDTGPNPSGLFDRRLVGSEAKTAFTTTLWHLHTYAVDNSANNNKNHHHHHYRHNNNCFLLFALLPVSPKPVLLRRGRPSERAASTRWKSESDLGATIEPEPNLKGGLEEKEEEEEEEEEREKAEEEEGKKGKMIRNDG